MTAMNGRITRALKKIETTCVEFAKKNKEATPELTINRLAQEKLENKGGLS